MIKYSILFYLNKDISLVQIKNCSDFVLIEHLQADPLLNLAVKLEQFWKDNWANIKDANQVYLWIGPNASFTDTRMIYIWSKTWQEFQPSKPSNPYPEDVHFNPKTEPQLEPRSKLQLKLQFNLKIWNAPEINLENPLTVENIQRLKKLSVEVGPNYRQELVYNQEPKIGRK